MCNYYQHVGSSHQCGWVLWIWKQHGWEISAKLVWKKYLEGSEGKEENQENF